MARPKKAVPAAPATKAEAPETVPATKAETVPETPKARMVTVYAVNTDTDEDKCEKKAVKPDSVGGVILEVVFDLGKSDQMATKSAILEEFRGSEKAGSIRASQWVNKPQEYVNGYVDWLKGNRSLTSDKADAASA